MGDGGFMDVISRRMMMGRVLAQMASGGGIVFPSYIEAGFITVQTSANTLEVPHNFGVKPSDAYLINMESDLNTNQTNILTNSAIGNLKSRTSTTDPYITRQGILHNYGTGNGGGSSYTSSSNLTEMDSTKVTFGKFNSYSRQYVAGEQYFYIIFNRTLPGDA